MRKRRQIELFSISFLDLLSGALGAVIIMYVAIPKNKPVKSVGPVETFKEELAISQKQLAEARAELALVKEKVAALSIPKPEATGTGKDLDIGFKFKGKSIVFIIDTSYSMTDEDRITQVKAGMKMLITSLSPEYKIEVIQYPNAERSPFRTLFGDVRENTNINRMDIFDFIYSLRPFGGTPTRDVLLFALRNYPQASDIVILSDGAPTFHNSNKKDDIFDILRVVRSENSHKVQINAIGVGSEFIKDKENDRYKFLSQLSIENHGFFVGF